jgi:hypothetical protein
MIRPGEMLHGLSSDPQLLDLAQQVDASTSAMINDAALQTEFVNPLVSHTAAP